MKKAEYQEIYSHHEQAEASFSQLSERLAFGLLAATWVLQSKLTTLRWETVISLLLPITFLGLKWLGCMLNIAHARRIIDAEQSGPGKYEDYGLQQTWQGHVSNALWHLERWVLGAGAVFFFYFAMFVLLQ